MTTAKPWDLLTTPAPYCSAILTLLSALEAPAPQTFPMALQSYLTYHTVFSGNSHVVTQGADDAEFGAYIVKGRIARLSRKVSSFSRKVEDVTVFQCRPHPSASPAGLEELFEASASAEDSTVQEALAPSVASPEVKIAYDALTLFDEADPIMQKFISSVSTCVRARISSSILYVMLSKVCLVSGFAENRGVEFHPQFALCYGGKKSPSLNVTVNMPTITFKHENKKLVMWFVRSDVKIKDGSKVRKTLSSYRGTLPAVTSLHFYTFLTRRFAPRRASRRSPAGCC